MNEPKRQAAWLSKDIKLYRGLSEDGKPDNNFYKNDNTKKLEHEGLRTGEDSQFNENDFKKLIKGESLRFVKQKFDNIVVLVGAGASVTDNKYKEDKNGIAETGVTVSKIAAEVLDKLSKGIYQIDEKRMDVFDLNETASISKYPTSNLTIDNLDKDFNLEDFLSNMFAYEKFVDEKKKGKFINTKEAILDIIVKATSYDFNNETFKHVRFLKVLAKLTTPKRKLNLVTTNYDTLLEDAAESMKWTIFDGFSFSQTPQFDSTMFDWNLVKDVPNVKTSENIYKSNVINLFKIHGSLTWQWSDSGKNIVRRNKKYIKTPIMVFPSSNKYAQSYQEPYFDLFSKFQSLLHKPNTLLITTGFSFSDNHIARMIISAIETNDGLSALITDFKIESQNNNWRELIKAMDNYYNIAFLQATLNGDLSEFLGGSVDDN